MGGLPRPRAATSVAVMMGLLPFLNSCMDSTDGCESTNGYSKTSGCLALCFLRHLFRASPGAHESPTAHTQVQRK